MSGNLIVTALTYLPDSWREWMVPPQPIPDIKNNASKVQLKRISHVYFQQPNLDKFAKFAKDFGFIEAHRSKDTIYYRGYGVDQYVYVVTEGRPQFKGVAFAAKSKEDFEKAARLPGASVRTLDNAPGGGQLVSFARPNGTLFYVLYGQQDRQVDVDMKQPPSATHESHGPFNTPWEKPRLGEFQRYHEGPALVHKLGHFGYACKEFDTEFAFYTQNFNFVHSDILHHPKLKGVDVMTFMHLDLGKEFTDHHCMFLQRVAPGMAKTYIHHCSFEVADFDTQLLGHHWLAKQGWKCVWGVGRHILGSQIFDYWADPSGFKVEHYVDGDLVNEDTAARRSALGPLSVWGPELPRNFAEDGTKSLFY